MTDASPFAPPSATPPPPPMAPPSRAFTRRELLAGVMAGGVSQVALDQVAAAWIAWSTTEADALVPGVLWVVPAVAVWSLAGVGATVASGHTEPDTAVLRGARAGALAGLSGTLASLVVAAAIAGALPSLTIPLDGPVDDAMLTSMVSGCLALVGLAMGATVVAGALVGAVAGSVAAAVVAAANLTRGGGAPADLDPWGPAAAAVASVPAVAPLLTGTVAVLLLLVGAGLDSIDDASSGPVVWLFLGGAVVAAGAAVAVGGAVGLLAGWGVRSVLASRGDPAVLRGARMTGVATCLVVLLWSATVGWGALQLWGGLPEDAPWSPGAHDLHYLPDVALLAGGSALVTLVVLAVFLLPVRAARPARPPGPWASVEAAAWWGLGVHAVLILDVLAGFAIGIGPVSFIERASTGAMGSPDEVALLVNVLPILNRWLRWVQLLLPLALFGWWGPAAWLVGRLRSPSDPPG